MGDFRRQPSKVWWSNYEDEALSMYSGFLGWGKGIDLSGNFTEGYNSNNLNNNTNMCSSTLDQSQTMVNKTSGSFVKSERPKPVMEKDEEDEDDDEDEDKENDGQSGMQQTLENDRGSSSSPSQGSHKSQDSGFSDSELQNNGGSLSPHCTPEMPARQNCIKCTSSQQQAADEKEKSYNETVANYRKLKTSVKATAANQYKSVEFNEGKYLETAFDGTDSTCGKENPGNKSDRSKDEVQVPRTTKTSDKINQIQNHLELTFKLPKKINLPQNLKISNLFHGKSTDDARIATRAPTPAAKPKAKSAETIPAFRPLSCVLPNETLAANKTRFDSDGFKVPKAPAVEQNFVPRSTDHLYDLATEIEGPPISCSTPKSSRFLLRGPSSLRRIAKTAEHSSEKTTFATIRKLKGLSEKKLKRPKTLIDSFNHCTSTGSRTSQTSRTVSVDFESSVRHWLSEIETTYEAEVMTTLQSKSLATDLTRQVTNMADTASHTVKKLHQKTKIISLEFSKLCSRQNKNKTEKQTGALVQSLVGHITEFLNEYVQKSSENCNSTNTRDTEEGESQRTAEPSQHPEKQQQEEEEEEKKEPEVEHEMITDFRKPEPETVEMKKEAEKNKKKAKTKEEEVLESCENLLRLTTSGQFDCEKVESQVAVLGQKFREVVDVLLESHIQALVRVLEEPRTELVLRTALSALTTLGLEGNQLGVVVSRCGGIRALLAICLEARATAVRVSALRALATVCCVADTIRQFEQAGGVEIISDILADEKRSEAELSEASAVIAQITAPWVQDNHSVEGLSQFLNSLVTSLTRIVGKYRSCETLLLSSAALANLTFMEPRTVWPLLEQETAKVLLSAVRRQGSKVSVFIMEQAATIIANMSAVSECRKHLGEQRAVVALLCFLEIHQSPLENAPEVAAAERVLQKSAIALSRLCSDTVVAKQVVELQGVNRLVRLCKEEKERNHSDGVLVACLAALRKIVANCGTEALEELNALELVEPRLLDSFLLYSSKQESYV